MPSPQCLDSEIWPGNREKAKAYEASRVPLERKLCLFEGPSFKFTPKWLFASYSGLIYLETYFWLIKDWAWSQLRWFWPAILFGSAAVVLGFILVLIALYFRVYSEAAAALGMFLWVVGNYWWMVSEIWGYYITEDSPDWVVPEIFSEEEGVDRFYDQHQHDTQKILLAAVCWLAFTSFILPFFYYDRDAKPIAAIVNRSPRYRFYFFFRDFIEYENFHLFFWALKDLFWAYGNVPGYTVALILTLTFMLDALYLTATSKGQMVDLFHYFAIIGWVISNAFWAVGELYVEEPREHDIPDGAYENYTFIPVQKDVFEFFWGRNICGWGFLFSVSTLALFYVYWVFIAKIPSEEDIAKSKEAKDLVEGSEHKG